MHGIGEGEHQHVAHGDGNGGGCCGSAHAEGDFLLLVDGRREQDGVGAAAQQLAVCRTGLGGDGEDGDVGGDVVEDSHELDGLSRERDEHDGVMLVVPC